MRLRDRFCGARRVACAVSMTALALVTGAGSAHGAPALGAGADELAITRTGYRGAVNFISAKVAGAPIKVDIAPPAPPIPAGAAGGGAQPLVLAFLGQYGGLMGITDPPNELVERKVEDDLLGQIHTTYQQVFKGVPVFSGEVKVHHNAKGEVLGANGRFYPIKPTMDVAPTLDQESASLAAIKEIRTSLADGAAVLTVSDQRLVIVDPAWYGDPAGRGASLAWYLEVNREEELHDAMFIDAHTGEVLDRWTLIMDALNRSILDGMGTTTVPPTPARAEGQAAVADSEVNKAYDYAGDYYRYLQRAFGRDSLNNAGLTLRILVNSTALTCPNANWNGSRCTFCTGVVTDEIVTHELTHGLTQYTANLIYQNQSGQLNESFSDVFGETLDQFNGNTTAIGAPGGTPWPMPPDVGPGVDTPNNARSVCSPRPSHPDGVRWLLGEDSSAFGGAIRDMWNPTCRNHPDRANSPLQTCASNDSGGVHSGSGVPNHAYALVTDGGTFNGHTISGIGLIKAGAVWYRALTVYLTSAADFKDAYDAFNHAASDLVGTTPNDPRTGLPSGALFTAFDAQQVDEALLSVEMNTDGLCGQGAEVLDANAPLECVGATVLFFDGFEGASLGWEVSNSAPPTPYDWVQSSAALPFGRPGKAAWCEDRPVGDCSTQNESSTHTMTSPAIVIPPSAGHPVLAFTHLLGAEGAFDGGVLEYSINGGTFNPMPRTVMEFNPYNNRLRSSALGNTNPLAGRDAWSGSGGRWGRTLVDLSGLGVSGSLLRLRFTLGKDGCTGDFGWYVDDLAVYDCPDCDSNTVADVRQFRYRASTAISGPIGTGADVQFTLTNVPQSAGTVTVECLANADLSASTEFISAQVNGVSIGSVFVTGGVDCASTPIRASLMVGAAAWNNAVALSPSGQDAVINLTGTADMNPAGCSGSFVALSVRHDLAPIDGNANFVLDSCEPPPCSADFNGSGAVDADDLFAFLDAWFDQNGTTAPDQTADTNLSGTVDADDLFVFLDLWFAENGNCP